MSVLDESVVEDAALAWLEVQRYSAIHGPAIAADEPATEHYHVYTSLA